MFERAKKKIPKKRAVEMAAEMLAQIFISQIEFQKNKDEKSYEKRK